MIYIGCMEIKPLHLKLDAEMVDRIDSYRFDARINTRTETIRRLLDYALGKLAASIARKKTK